MRDISNVGTTGVESRRVSHGAGLGKNRTGGTMSTEEIKRPVPQLPSSLGRMGLSRRAIMARSGALGAGAALGLGLSQVGAQDATPGASPEAASPQRRPLRSPSRFVSVTREAYAQIPLRNLPDVRAGADRRADHRRQLDRHQHRQRNPEFGHLHCLHR